MLEQLKSRNPKFVLYGLAFVAEVVVGQKNDVSVGLNAGKFQCHLLAEYLLEHKASIQMWIL